MSSTPFHLSCVYVACFVDIGVQFCKRASCALLCVCQSLIFAIFSLFHKSLSLWSCPWCCGLCCCYPPCATACSAPLALLVVISSSLAHTCRSPLCALILVLSLLQIMCACPRCVASILVLMHPCTSLVVALTTPQLLAPTCRLYAMLVAPHWLLPLPRLNRWHLNVNYMPCSLHLNCYYFPQYQFACVSLPSSQAL